MTQAVADIGSAEKIDLAMEEKRLLPPVYLLIAILLVIVLHLAVPLGRIIPAPWNLLGIVPLAAGILINVIADRAFRSVGTTVKPFEPSSALVTTGVYRISRHPMYLGLVLIVLGLAGLLGSALPLAVVVIFALLLDRRFIEVEERILADRFGADWEEYRRRVRRWL